MVTRRHRGDAHALGTALVAVAVAIVALLLSARVALGATVLDYDSNRTKNPVADNITRLNVNKLEKGSHDYVPGAHMCIIEKETGRLVTEWRTGEETHEVARNVGDKSSLNVDVVYILRELEAPEGYSQAADTEFVLHSDDKFNTTGEIISGPDAEFDAIQGNGDVQAFVINLYDEAVSYEEDIEYRRREGDAGSDVAKGKEDKGGLIQTGAAVSGGIAIVAVVALVVGIVAYRKQRDA